jgi:predicted nucleotide-binding protein (sugar kinase/HSP70/actin superfamily)
MGEKPFLTLELDAHTADAGVDTRIEAFLDIVGTYRRTKPVHVNTAPFHPARIVMNKGDLSIHTSEGDRFTFTDSKVHILIPSMGDNCARGLAAALVYAGVKATAVPPPGREELRLGAQCASCKECLPYLVTSGSLRRYLRDRNDKNEVLLYLMPEADGPCRFGLYGEALRTMILKERLKNVAVLSPTSTNSYQGLPALFPRRALIAAAVTDGLDDIRAGVLTLAQDRKQAMRVLMRVEESIQRSRSLTEVTRVLLTGEIYVRRDSFSNHHLVQRLAEEGILVKVSPVLEWLFYTDHIVINGLLNQASLAERLALWLRNRYSKSMVAHVQKVLEQSGFFHRQNLDVGFLVDRGRHLIDPRLTGEAILTVSSTLAEIGDDVHGVISISPFGCMPGRIAEALISHRLEEDKPLFSRHNRGFWSRQNGRLSLPFLALETDGNPLSQMAETKLESFILSAHRLNRELSAEKMHDRLRLESLMSEV